MFKIASTAYLYWIISSAFLETPEQHMYVDVELDGRHGGLSSPKPSGLPHSAWCHAAHSGMAFCICDAQLPYQAVRLEHTKQAVVGEFSQHHDGRPGAH
jgi:hypothetical protein